MGQEGGPVWPLLGCPRRVRPSAHWRRQDPACCANSHQAVGSLGRESRRVVTEGGRPSLTLTPADASRAQASPSPPRPRRAGRRGCWAPFLRQTFPSRLFTGCDLTCGDMCGAWKMCFLCSRHPRGPDRGGDQLFFFQRSRDLCLPLSSFFRFLACTSLAASSGSDVREAERS